MATKKTNSKAPAKEQKRNTPNISARIDRLVDYENSKVKAIASVSKIDRNLRFILYPPTSIKYMPRYRCRANRCL